MVSDYYMYLYSNACFQLIQDIAFSLAPPNVPYFKNIPKVVSREWGGGVEASVPFLYFVTTISPF